MNQPLFWGLKQRTEPCIWSKSEEALFDHQKYIANGHILLKKFNQHLDISLIEQVLKSLYNTPSSRHIPEPDGKSVRSYFDIHHACPELLRHVLNRGLIAITNTILGGESVIYQSHVNFKSARQGDAFDWHSDYTYWHHHDGMMNPRAISIIIPFGKHNKDNGGIQILSGSHQYLYPTHLNRKKEWQTEEVRHGHNVDRLANGLVPDDLIQHPDFRKNIFYADMNIGDCLIMDANAWHFSPPNKSTEDRATLFIIATHADNPFDPAATTYRPSHIKCMKRIPLNSFSSERF